MTWGMEDPAARAREGLSLESDDAWSGGGTRRRRPKDGIWVLVFIVLAASAIIFTLQREDEAAADSPRAAIARGEVAGLAEGSMARPANLAAFLDAAREQAAPEDRVKAIRVAPARVNLTMVTPAGRQYFIDGSANGRVSSRDFADTNQAATARIGDIDPAAVRRAVATVARQGSMPPARFDYLVLTDPGAQQRFFVVFEADNVRDKNWIGGGNGGQMRRSNPDAPGGQVPPEPAAGPGAPANPGISDALRIAQCVEQAGSDPAAIQGCLR